MCFLVSLIQTFILMILLFLQCNLSLAFTLNFPESSLWVANMRDVASERLRDDDQQDIYLIFLQSLLLLLKKVQTPDFILNNFR